MQNPITILPLTGKAHALQDRTETIAGRIIKWARLRKIPKKEKKLAITVFSFPPDKGNVGSAAYLDVFGSMFELAKQMKKEGYTVEGLPETSREMLEMVVTDSSAKYASPEQALRLSNLFIGSFLSIQLPQCHFEKID